MDTETSGLPADWSQPYAAEQNWPYIAQLAWVIYTKDGRQVKVENHYLQIPEEVTISPKSVQIHGLTAEFLRTNGQDRGLVMQRLHDDLMQYQPLVVAHFMELDEHMVGAGFYRAHLANPLPALPTFCTMKLTEQFVRPARQRYLSLGELYKRLFHEPLLHQHDALVDAQAAARCFFEMQRTGDIDEHVLAQQQLPAASGPPRRSFRRYWLGLLAAFLILLVLYLAS
jgi:DNA polymerase-3 subunit epsilon